MIECSDVPVIYLYRHTGVSAYDSSDSTAPADGG